MLKKSILTLLFCSLSLAASAEELKVVSAYPYITDLVKQVAGNHVKTYTLAKGDWDPHFVVPKPSLVRSLRNADLLVINGAQLEIGWLPPLLRQANNNKVQPGQAGFLELSQFVTMIQKPQNVSRAMGDVHPQGNPHFALDPDNIPKITASITQKLCALDGEHCGVFKANQSKYLSTWKSKVAQWNKQMAPLKGKKVVEYHRLHDYFLTHYGLGIVNTLEPLPGIPPTPQHLAKVLRDIKANQVTLNIRGSYNPGNPSEFIARKSSAKTVTLPHDVGSVKGATSVIGMYDTLVKLITR